MQSQAIDAIVRQLLYSFGVSFWDEGRNDSHYLSPSPSVLLKSTWNYQYNNDWTCLTTCGNTRLNAAVTQHCRTGCPSLKPMEPLHQQWHLHLHPSGLAAVRLGTALCEHLCRVSEALLFPQEQRICSFQPLITPQCWPCLEAHTYGRCNSWSGGSEVGFLRDGPEAAVIHQGPEAKETP